MVNFHPQWKDMPDSETLLAFLQENYPKECEEYDMETAINMAALYSHDILGEEIDNIDIEDMSPELINFFRNLPLTGNPIERGLKVAKIQNDHNQRYIQQLLNIYGETVAKGIIQESLDEAEAQEFGEKGGKSHGGNWFGGMEVDTPIYMDDKEKAKVKEAAKKLKSFRSFNLQAKSSPIIHQDDWGDMDILNIGRPEDFGVISPEQFGDDDLFDYLFMKRNLKFWETFSKKIMPNIWVVLIDDSGSMNNNYKLQWVLAFLGILAEDVIKNKSIAYVAMFEMDLSPFWKLHDLASVEAFMSFYRGGRGGTTDVEGALCEVAGQLKTGNLQTHDGVEIVDSNLEIFIINDGNDDVSSNFVPPAKTHSLMLYENNPDLANATKRSGGTPLFVDKKGLHQI